jgi:hypothetical protein
MVVPTECLGSPRTVAARANAAALGFGEIATWALFVTLALTGLAGTQTPSSRSR